MPQAFCNTLSDFHMEKTEYGIIPCLTFVWFFSFSSTFYVVPVVLYNAKKVGHSNVHIKSKNQNTKRRMKTKNINFFYFLIKKS